MDQLSPCIPKFNRKTGTKRSSTLKPRDPLSALVDTQEIWIHASKSARHGAICALAQRLLEQRPDLGLVLTSSTLEFTISDPRIQILNDFNDTTQSRAQFFRSFAPHIVIWVGGHLSSSQLTTFQGPNTLSILADAKEDGFAIRKLSFLPNPDKRLLGYFDLIVPVDAETKDTLTRLGVADETMPYTGPMQASALLPSGEGKQITIDTGNRQAWFAAELHADERPLVLKAHHSVLRQSHSTLLLLAAHSNAEVEALKSLAQEHRLRAATLDPEQTPDSNTQVGIFLCGAEEISALYRAASVSFIGHSLLSSLRGRSATQAAAVGSAICYGPNSADFAETYRTLAQVGGARMVNDAQSLGQAVVHMLTASTAAAMALNTWSALTEGAEITDAIVDLALNHLDDIGV